MPNKHKMDVFQACRDEDYDLVVFFVEVSRVDLSLKDKFGKPALYYATQTKNKRLINYVKEKLEAQALEKKNKASRHGQSNQYQSSAPDKFSKSPLPSLVDDDINTLREGVEDKDTQELNTNTTKPKPSSIIKKAELNIENVTKNDIAYQQDENDSLNGSSGSINPDLEALSNLFPDISIEVLQIVLKDSQGSLEFAVEMLLDGQHANKSQNKTCSRTNKNSNFVPVINSAADFPSLSTKKKNKQKKKKSTSPAAAQQPLFTDNTTTQLIQHQEEEEEEEGKEEKLMNNDKKSQETSVPVVTEVTHVLSESNLKTLENKTKHNIKQEEEEEGSEFEHVEQDGEWSEIEDANVDEDDEDDIDVQSVPESDITDDWDVYFNHSSPENDHWEEVENPDVKVSKVDESDWIIKDELDKSYANVVRSSTLPLASQSTTTTTTVTSTATKSPMKLTPLVQASSLEMFVNNEGVHVLNTSENGKKKKGQAEYCPEEEFYITKEGRVYGKASKTNKGTSSKPPQLKVGRPAGSAKVM